MLEAFVCQGLQKPHDRRTIRSKKAVVAPKAKKSRDFRIFPDGHYQSRTADYVQ